MKTLHAKNALLAYMLFGVAQFLAVLPFSIMMFWEGDIDEGVCLLVGSLVLIPLPVVVGIKIYRTHWIKYGDGKVTIRRVSKKRVNGRPVGKWENREDTFLLEEIESFGLSWLVLGHLLEYHDGRKIETEYFFKLKSGKMIGFEIGYYTRNQDKEFRRYIYENTGIKFQEPKKKKPK